MNSNHDRPASRSVMGWFTIVATLCSLGDPIMGQPIPDTTLGNEASQVIERGDRNFDIDGGARRGRNLFHSFSDFNVDEGGSVYFRNADGVANIFSRVTGTNPSNILGILGVRGAANLFLLNPNGILFGAGASLDVNGSFVATTANALQFGNQGFFSATNPEVPAPLLAIDPSVFLFNQIPVGNIANQSIAPAGTSPAGFNVFGLRVPDGESFLLLGGDIAMDGGRLNAFGGHIELGGLAGVGTVDLTQTDNALHLNFALDSVLANVNLINDARSVVRGEGGSITLNANEFTAINGGRLVGGIETTGNAGNILVNTNRINLTGTGSTGIGAGVYQDVLPGAIGNTGNIDINTRLLSITSGGQIGIQIRAGGTGNAGNITVVAPEAIELSGTSADEQLRSAIFNESYGIGNSGSLLVTTGQLNLTGGASISTTFAGSTGQGGDLMLNADMIELVGTSASGRFRSAIGSETGGSGRAGNTHVITRRLSIQDGAILSTGAYGNLLGGEAGDLTINADTIELVGTSANEQFRSTITSETNGSGNAGAIEITAGQLAVRGGGVISTSMFGDSGGAGGDLTINADTIELVGTSANEQFRSAVSSETSGSGRAGNTNITAGQLNIREGAILSTGAYGNFDSDAGYLTIKTYTTELVGASASGQFRSEISSETNSSGNAGNVDITTGQLGIREGASISTSTFSNLVGEGDAGNIIINAANQVTFNGTSSDGQFVSAAYSSVGASSIGNGGNIEITAPVLEVLNGAQLSASTLGQGNAGSIIINATDHVTFRSASSDRQFVSGAFSTVDESGNGNGGNIEINAPLLEVLDGAQLQASTFGQGDAGNIIISATDRATFQGRSDDSFISGAFSRVEESGNGNGGNIEITAPILEVLDGAQLSVGTLDEGDGGALKVNADLIDLRGAVLLNGQVFRSALSAETRGVGRAGNIQLNTEDLRIRDGAGIFATTSSAGNGGNIRIRSNSIAVTGTNPTQHNISSAISTIVGNQNSTGNAGEIRITGDRLRLSDRGTIASDTFGRGNAGEIFIQMQDSITLSRGYISSRVSAGGTGDGNNIQIQTANLSLANGGQIGASVLRPSRDAQDNLLPAGQGRAGNITIRALDSVRISGIDRDGFSSGILTTTERATQGRAGNITISANNFRIAGGGIIIAGSSNNSPAGDITINANTFEAIDGGVIVTTARRNGRAGDITLNVTEDVHLSGNYHDFDTWINRVDRYIRNNPSERRSDIFWSQETASGLFANTARGSHARGGRITVNTHDLTLTDNAVISSASQGRGQAGRIQIQATGDLTLNNRSAISTQSQRNQAGDIAIQADRIEATHSDITTSAVRSSGGNIRLVASQIRLNGDSDLRTNSRTEGGNITLSADSILAFEDSDIFAFAGARGGDIQLDTPAFFGNQYQSSSTSNSPEDLDGNDRTDINASGQVSSGTISTPDTSFIQNSLSDLPESAIDTQALISSSCVVRREEQSGSFTVTGTGGLPERPGELPRPRFPTGEVRSIPDAASDSGDEWQVGDPIVEPQGVYQLPDGQLVLSRECD